MAKPSVERTWVAETRFSGVIAELRLPRRSVERLLPPELCLGPGASRRATAPLLMAFGRHTGSAVHMAALQVRTGVSFHEVFFGVRCLIAASRTPVLFVPLMYCDEPVSTWSGNALYGFNKRVASMEWLGESFVVAGEDGRVILRATSDGDGSRSAGMPRWADVTMPPVLGRRRDGTYVATCFAWQWKRAHVRTARVSVTVETALTAGLLPGESFASARSAVRVSDLPWCVAWPDPCHAPPLHSHEASTGVTGADGQVYVAGRGGGRPCL